jgi:uncharacterized ion transporter superfamily protein YfcC
MEQKAGAQIGMRAFIQSLVILLILMVVSGVLTLVIPAGQYTRMMQDGREVIDPLSFHVVERPDYPVWRWATAPFEVLFAPGGLNIAVILIFLLMVGASFAVLDGSGILKAAIGRLVRQFGGRRYLLLLVVSFFFMLVGAFFGIFEEVVPLVPVMLALSYYMGWDALVGLGMSILATNLGFSAAITNPFSIGVAQKLAGLPLFSGWGFRILIFLVIYTIFALFITAYARRIDRDPKASLVYSEDQAGRARYQNLDIDSFLQANPHAGRGITWFLVFLGIILLTLIGGPFIPAIADYTLPIVGLLFLIGGMGAGWVAATPAKKVWKAVGEGLAGIAPGIPLILMAASIKHIATSGGIMDTILNSASQAIDGTGPFAAILLVYGLALVIELFIGSATAKSFLLMPILLPLADLVGLTRQLTVTAYCFGDGFSNLAYPTNPVLLIALGLTVVSYPKWMRWTLKLWFWIILATLGFLALGLAINYGPF